MREYQVDLLFVIFQILMICLNFLGHLERFTPDQKAVELVATCPCEKLTLVHPSDTEFHNQKFFCSAGPFHVGVVVSTPGCDARGPGFKSRQKQGAKKGPVDSDFI